MIENEHQAPEGEVAKNKRCDTDDTNPHRTLAENGNIDRHEWREFTHPYQNDYEGGKEKYALERIVGTT